MLAFDGLASTFWLSTPVVEVADATSNKCGTPRAISSKATAMMDAVQSKALLTEAKHEIVAARSALQT